MTSVGASVPQRSDIRNVAIIAHVDHGKTTLVDAMLRQSGVFAAHEAGVTDRVMDSMDQERERGITILAKNAAVRYGDVKLNLVDTPGHADFGGEVERGLTMVDGVMLLVDASEGPLPQTRFVLRKALEARLPVVLVREQGRPARTRASREVVDEVYELFLDLDADEDADRVPDRLHERQGGLGVDRARASRATDLRPLLDLLVERIPAPEYDEAHRCRRASRTSTPTPTSAGSRSAACTTATIRRRPAGGVVPARRRPWSRCRVTELYVNEGLERVAADEAGPGEIIALAGIPEITIGETIADPADPRPLPVIAVDEPALGMTIGINTSPLAGQSGSRLTARQVRGPARAGAGRQRGDPRARDRAPRHLGGAGPRRAAARGARRDDAARGLRADRGQAAGGHARGRRRSSTSRSSGCRSTCPRTSSAWSPRCWRCARAGWRTWSTTAPAGCGSTSSCPRAA